VATFGINFVLTQTLSQGHPFHSTLASLRCTRQQDYGPCRVLQSGHAACILVKRVEKPTDNESASLLCCRVADADSPETISPRWPRRTSPHPSVRLGPRLLRRKYPVPLLRAGPDTETRPQSPGLGGTREGDRGRVRMSLPRRTARGRYYEWPIRHSVGRKMAFNGNIAESVGIRTLGLK
jgi:hypothetical protein